MRKLIREHSIVMAFAAVFAAETVVGEILPSWSAIGNDAGANAVVTCGDHQPPVKYADLTRKVGVELPVSGPRKRVRWDFALPFDFTQANALTFDLRIDDFAGITHVSLYLKSGDGWYCHDLSVEKEGAWQHVRWARRDKTWTEGKPSGFHRIDGVRLAIDRSEERRTTTAAVADFALETEAVVEAPAEVAARAAALVEKRRAFVRSVPGRAGERRLAWCHTAYGMAPDLDWDASVRFLKENGFTDLIANLAWADCAFYNSRVVPVDQSVATRGDAFEQCRAACRKYGVGFHVWRVCYNMGGHFDRVRVEHYRAEGRLAQTFDVKAKSPWGTTFCPSHPENQRLEVEAMVEIARKGADGIHFDYIRYANRDFCFCDGCRRRFEAQLGRPVEDWPADVRRDADLAVAWVKWRAETISAVVAETARRVRTEFPEVEISVAARPDRDSAYAGDGQDWVRWSKEGWIDVLCPMDYTDATPFFRNAACAQLALLAGTRVQVCPGIGLSCWEEDGAEAEKVTRHIEALRQHGFGGFTVFALDRRARAVFPQLREGPTRAAEVE